LVQDLNVPVFIHPPHVGFGEERVKEYRLASSVGRPADLCLALSRLIVRGILEDFPRLTIVASHGGGGLWEVIGRLNYAYELQEECYFLGPYSPIKIRHEPGYYAKRMYFDTVTYHAPAAQLVVDSVGADHVLYGSDAPPLTSLKPRAIALVESLRVTNEQREKIFWRNAAKLLTLDLAKLETAGIQKAGAA
jgi:aminocarboxymuconate-semialdehyde decarboxylase